MCEAVPRWQRTPIVSQCAAILSSSSVLALRETGDSLHYFKQQAVWLGLGVLAMIAAAFTPMRWWRRAAFPMFVVSVVLLIAVLAVGRSRLEPRIIDGAVVPRLVMPLSHSAMDCAIEPATVLGAVPPISGALL